MTNTKNDTTAVTRSIMVASENKAKKEAAKAAEKPKKTPAPAKASAKKPVAEKTASQRISDSHEEFINRIKAENAAMAAAKKAEANKEETAVAMSTDSFSKEILTEFQKRSKAIKSAIGKIDSSTESIAFNLYWIYVKQAYKSEGYANIESYCSEVFGYGKSTCYSYISVVERFAKCNEKGEMLEAFDEHFKDYSVSKLSLMINLTNSEIDSLKPTMSVRDIKKFVKGLEGKALPELSEGNRDLEECEPVEDEPEDENIVDSTATVISNTIIRFKALEDFENKCNTMYGHVLRVYKQHPDAVIEVSYTLPAKKEEKA